MNTPLIFRPYCPSFHDTVYRDLLPHRSSAGRTLFVTWRLSDSLPAKAEFDTILLRAQKRWLLKNQLPFDPYAQDVKSILLNRYPGKISDFRLIHFRVREQFDSKQLGSCILREREAIDAIRSAILEEQKWDVGIGDFVISFNHVHLLMVMGEKADLKRSVA
jgi:hypothetical protein